MTPTHILLISLGLIQESSRFGNCWETHTEQSWAFEKPAGHDKGPGWELRRRCGGNTDRFHCPTELDAFNWLAREVMLAPTR